MSELITYRLDEIADVIDCEHKTAPKVDSSEYYSIRTPDIKNGRLLYEQANRVSAETYTLWSKRGIPEAGDIILAREAPVGEVGWIDKDHKICLGQRTVLIKIHSTEIDKKFLLYSFVSPKFKDYLNELSGGSVVAHLNIKDIRALEFSFPSLPEQKAIASVLSSLDDKIDLLHRQNKTLEAMAETLFRQWFIEEAKEDWGEASLSEYFKVKHGYAFKGEYIIPEMTKYRLVTPGNFEIGGGFKSTKFKYYSDDLIPEDYIFDELDFVVTMTDLSKEGDTLGYPAFIPLHQKSEVMYLHNQRVGKVQFHNVDESKFFFYMLMKQDVYQQFVVGSCTGTSVKHTSPTTIGSFTFTMPPQERVQEFDQIVRQQFAKIFQNQMQIQTLEKFRDTLLPKLMSGEVRVQYQQATAA